ncbi:MAG: RagB/SusD family nutrient uptake outer membrane protein, partial [Bacteroidales bacterium]|nr:RagB/SusD family nutrient uptake outer membrane protein [Bacteroidales bacterium]
MSIIRKYFLLVIPLLGAIMLLPSCEDFLNPEQEIKITEDKLFKDWYEYRSVGMGLYGLQQQLVEQILILGELRGDLLTITPNADADLVEIYNFNVSKTNKYASPTDFFKLITACNNFIRVLQTNHPEVLVKNIPASNYDKIYGEALCMRAWAYFNAVRIYGKVPFIHESLNTVEKVEEYIHSSGPYTHSTYIIFGPDGYHNMAYHNGILTPYTIDSSWTPEPKIITLEKKFFDLDLVIDYFTNQLEKEVKAVGVDYAFNNNDVTWEVTTWNPYAMNALLGLMYLEQGNFLKAEENFSRIIYNTTENLRYQLDDAFSGGLYNNNWRNIFMGIDNREHIFTIWFNKANFQQNELQSFFEPFTMDKYMLKPTAWAVTNWETTWRNQVISENLVKPSESEMIFAGIPSDFARGFGTSYLYMKNGNVLPPDDYIRMLFLRAEGDNKNSTAIMDGVDTIV